MLKSFKLLTDKITTGDTIWIDLEMDRDEPVDIFVWFEGNVANHWVHDEWKKVGNTYHLAFSFSDLGGGSGQFSLTSVSIRNADSFTMDYHVKYSDKMGYYLGTDSDSIICDLTGYKSLNYTKKSNDPEPPKIVKASIRNRTIKRPGLITIDFHVTDNKRIQNCGAAIQDGGIEFNADTIFFPEDEVHTDYTGTINIPIPSGGMMSRIGSYPVFIFVYDGENFTRQELGNVTIEDEFQVAFDFSINNPKLENTIRQMKDGESGKILINVNKPVATKSAFKAIQGKNVNIIFYTDYYYWVFNGKDIVNPKDISLPISIDIMEGDAYGVEGSILEIRFPENGQLPGKAQIRIKSDIISAIYNYTGRIYLYYENENDGNIDLIEGSNTQLVIDGEDRWCYFDIFHNSKYLLSGKKLNTVKKNEKKNAEKVYPAKGVSAGIIYKFDTKRKTAQVIGVQKLNRKKITIPSTVVNSGRFYKVTAIKAYAFKNNKKIQQVAMGKNLISIGTGAFKGCKNLRKVSIGKNVSSIGNYAFYQCIKLQKIILPSKVKKIGSYVFRNCKSLKSITIKSKKLTKKSVKNSLRGSMIKGIKVKVGSKKENEKVIKKYRKFFTKKNAGKTVSVK